MRAVAYILAVYMALGSLLPGTDFSQLSRIPSLLDHFSLHQQLAEQTGEQLSFLQFVHMHFYQTNSHAEDANGAKHDHQELPLQSVSIHLELALCTALPSDINFPAAQVLSIFTYRIPQGSNYASTLLQPPIA